MTAQHLRRRHDVNAGTLARHDGQNKPGRQHGRRPSAAARAGHRHFLEHARHDAECGRRHFQPGAGRLTWGGANHGGGRSLRQATHDGLSGAAATIPARNHVMAARLRAADQCLLANRAVNGRRGHDRWRRLSQNDRLARQHRARASAGRPRAPTAESWRLKLTERRRQTDAPRNHSRVLKDGGGRVAPRKERSGTADAAAQLIPGHGDQWRRDAISADA